MIMDGSRSNGRGRMHRSGRARILALCLLAPLWASGAPGNTAPGKGAQASPAPVSPASANNAPASHAPPAPMLKYTPPEGYIGEQGRMDPQVYVDGMVEGSVEVTGFKPFQGDFRAAFQQTLFADRMSERFRHPQLQGPPRFQPATIPGADDALFASFGATQDYYTYAHARLAILARGAVAIVDIRAQTVERFNADWPAVQKMLDSIRVVDATGGAGASAGGSGAAGAGGTTHAPGPAASRVAGLYIGSRMMFQGDPMGGVGSGSWVASSYWYLLAPDGRVQRGYRVPKTPNGDITRFDFDAARREAPQDSGTYTVEGSKVTLVMGEETLLADIAANGGLSIRGTPFAKSLPFQ